jgi:hypothetical protein
MRVGTKWGLHACHSNYTGVTTQTYQLVDNYVQPSGDATRVLRVRDSGGGEAGR